MQILLIADTHLFYRDDLHPAYELVMGRFLREVHPDKVMILGDFMDFGYISKFSKGKWGVREGVRMPEDFAFAREELEKIQDLSDAQVVLLEGNHDYRLRALREEDPLMGEMLEMDKQLGLEEIGVEWVPRLEQPYRVGGMGYLHGEIAVKYHVRRSLETYYENLCYGHVHRPQMDTLPLPGMGIVLKGYSLGCLSPVNPSYLKGRPSAWSLGFGWAETDMESTTITQIPVDSNGFVFQGRSWR